MEEEILKNHICTVPFTSLEIHDNQYFLCCPSWLKKKFSRKENDLSTIWNSKEVQEIRETILDGTYKYCDRNVCPILSKLLNFPNSEQSPPMYKKENLPSEIKYFIENKTTRHKNESPDNVIFNFDRTCNYKCPSCRVNLIVESKNGIERINKTIDEIDNLYSNHVKTIYITGSGDPFVSVAFRNYLRNFDYNKYPTLNNIHLHTNASMWNKDMWDSIYKTHKFIKSCEISIDAATKETYENKVRIGGNWEELIDNLKFISTIKSLKRIKVSFVVQKENYHEMSMFVKLMKNIFGERVQIFFSKILNWGTFSEEKYFELKVWEQDNTNYDSFLNELNLVNRYTNVTHNFYDLVNIKKTLF